MAFLRSMSAEVGLGHMDLRTCGGPHVHLRFGDLNLSSKRYFGEDKHKGATRTEGGWEMRRCLRRSLPG